MNSDSSLNFLDSAKHTVGADNLSTNVRRAERYASIAGGAFLVLFGLRRIGKVDSFASMLAGGALLHRGLSGHCAGYQALGIGDDADGGETDPADYAVHVEKSVNINKPADELYRHWRDFTNLPGFMEHLESVTVQDEKRSHWTAKAPFGSTVEWDAEITDDKPGERIAWRSTEGADVPNAGVVEFIPQPPGRGTTVRVTLDYNPFGGKAGALVAKLFGEEPQQQVSGDLWRFKQTMETGEQCRAY